MQHLNDPKTIVTETKTTNLVATQAPIVEQRNHATAVHEVVKPTQLEEIQPIVHREIEKTEVHQITQPIYEKSVLPTQVQTRMLPQTSRPDVHMGGPAPAMMQDVSTRVVQNSAHQTIVKPAIVEQVVRPHIIEEVQPVIYREVVQPTVIRETQPITEHIYERPTIIRETRTPIYHGDQQLALVPQPQYHEAPIMHQQPMMYAQPSMMMNNHSMYDSYGMPASAKHHHPHVVFGRKHHDSGAHAGMLGSGPRHGLGYPSHSNLHALTPVADGYVAQTGYTSQTVNALTTDALQTPCDLHCHSSGCQLSQHGHPTMGFPQQGYSQGYQNTAYSALVPGSSPYMYHSLAQPSQKHGFFGSRKHASQAYPGSYGYAGQPGMAYTRSGHPIDPLYGNPDVTSHSWRASHRLNKIDSQGGYMHPGAAYPGSQGMNFPAYYY